MRRSRRADIHWNILDFVHRVLLSDFERRELDIGSHALGFEQWEQKPDIWSTSRFFEPQRSEHSYRDKEKTERIFDVFIEQRRANIHRSRQDFINGLLSFVFETQKPDMTSEIPILSIETQKPDIRAILCRFEPQHAGHCSCIWDKGHWARYLRY